MDGATGAPRVQLDLLFPAHWDHSQPVNTHPVRLIQLPLPTGVPGSALSNDPLEAAAAAAGLDPDAVSALTQQGLSRADALAALLMGGGSADGALEAAFNCQDLGGAAQVWADTMQPRQVVDDVVDVLQAAEEAAKARALADEAESVLKLLERTGSSKGLTRDKVLKIERIQHAKLWRRFALRRTELLESRGREGLNEKLLFHGTGSGTADRIVQEGFDMRLVNHASAYGNGTYFAESAATAYDYCMRPDNTAAAAGFAAAGGFGPGPVLTRVGGAMPPAVASFFGSMAPGYVLPPAAATLGQQGEYKMIVARVALGLQTAGHAGMRRPPDGYDSVYGGASTSVSSVYCHVVFDNESAYPEYVITLRR